tara:strand:+ start:1160 stop:1591 length:432 start_codon:yes stop_codon:yes gene_type:complete
MEVDDLVNVLLLKEPNPPNSIDLDFTEQIDLIDLFEFLLAFFTEGTKKLFGDENGTVNLPSLTDSNLILLNKYYKSFGFQFYIDTKQYNLLSSREIKEINDNKYNKINILPSTPLKKLKFSIKIKEYIYIINFDFYINDNKCK